MLRIILLSSILILSGCASLQSPPMKAGDIKTVKSGKTAVMFYDPIGKITYLEDSYRVLAIFTNTTEASYKGFWDMDKYMSKLHSNNLRKLGINAESIYKRFNAKEISYLNKKQKNMYKRWNEYLYDGDAKKINSKLVDADLRKRLIRKGYSYLVWIPHRGYSLHMRTLGLAPLEQLFMSYSLHDLKKDKVLWKGGFNTYTTLDLKGKTAKDYLERNSLKGYKSRVNTLTRSLYEGKHNGTVGVALGLVQPQ